MCDPQAPGIVCENDIALVVLDNISTPASLTGQRPGDVGGYFNFASGDFGYTNLNGNTGLMSAQITLVGYALELVLDRMRWIPVDGPLLTYLY